MRKWHEGSLPHFYYFCLLHYLSHLPLITVVCPDPSNPHAPNHTGSFFPKKIGQTGCKEEWGLKKIKGTSTESSSCMPLYSLHINVSLLSHTPSSCLVEQSWSRCIYWTPQPPHLPPASPICSLWSLLSFFSASVTTTCFCICCFLF